MSKVIHDLVLIRNQAFGTYYHRLDFHSEKPLPVCTPGQFAECKVPSTEQVFLRRPFSIHSIDYQNNTISFLIKVVGEGSRTLGLAPVGTLVNTVFPLGKGFSKPSGSPILMVGGGCGIAPLLFLAEYLHDSGYQPHALLGGRTRDDIVETEDFARFGKVMTTTEDGSHGEKGFVTDHNVFADLSVYSQIYACGPEGMLRAVALRAVASSVPCEVSLENTMACGIGVCLCCVVETKKGNQCVCTEGPVFNIHELKGWDTAHTVADTCPVS